MSWRIPLKETRRYTVTSHLHFGALLLCLDCDGCLLFFFLNQVIFYIILSTKNMSLDTTEIDIDLQLQT